MATEKDVRDMSKATLIKAAFRVLRLKLAKAKVPLIVTNHVYAVIGCLKGDANIIMADGSTKNITDVVVGDTVKTLDGTQPVTELFQYNVSDTYEIAFEDGTTVTATPNHKFLTTDGRWVRADELRETDEIRVGLSTERSSMKITSITKQTAPVTVYDFTVQDAHHYFLSNGVVSHNSYFPTKEMAGGCLVAGTPIFMADGTLQNIEDIAVGAWVKTLDGDCCVSDTFRFMDKPLFEIELETGECVRCSAEHRFLVGGVWVEAGSLHAGDEVEVLRNINSDEEINDVSLLLPDHEHDTV